MSRQRNVQRFAARLTRSKWAQAASGLMLWAGGTLGGHALGQTPEPAAVVVPQRTSAATYHLNKFTIQLPIQLEDKYRPLLQEIQLWCKESPAAPWTLRDKAPPTQTAFNFQAPKDGEYFFTMVTVDRQGKCVPADIAKEEPAMAVVVDTQAPQLEPTLVGSLPEGHVIQCDVQDAHLDPARTRMQYQTADKVFRDLEPAQDRPNTWCIPAQANITGQLRFFASDLAGNVTTRECTLAQLSTPAKSTPAKSAQAGLPIAPPIAPLAGAPLVMPGEKLGHSAPAVEPKIQMPGAEKPVGPALLPGNLAASPGIGNTQGTTVPQAPPLQQAVSKSGEPAASPPIKLVGGMSNALPAQEPVMPQVLPGNVQTATVPKQGAPVQHMLVNNARVFLDYRIEKAGPSGVGRVEIWCTRDSGQSWQKLGEDHNRKSPAEALLPGDGTYGLTLVVSNGLGFGAQPPAAGDTPDWWIEVDTTRPAAQLTSVRLAPEDGPAVHVGWTSQDRNLGTGPAELSYAVSRQGPWLSIAKNLKADGEFRWLPPTDIGPQAFLRLTVRDLAGNTTSTETTSPIALDDLSRPRARINGITVDAVPVSAPLPNGH
jgi:hypothetical protein